MNISVLHLTRSPPIPILKRLPPLHMFAWSQYHEAWQSVFRDATKYVKDLPVTTSTKQCHEPSTLAGNRSICHKCQCGLFTLIAELEGIGQHSSLKGALAAPSVLYPSLPCCAAPAGIVTLVPACRHVNNLTNLCQEKIRNLPSFSSFLSQKN
ncbi:hypothetical protein CPB84DRAFT_1775930 [Gymnopilus junonius]|uniref:Uncharacterized protein n=1 Tax=Gymnopilus junonius TaxID=109634 RepID=A0A9P5NRR3_GYMJU|nr:hypothetical protein CPB84DRAFT_1775930 [Gymnopilus junonius]